MASINTVALGGVMTRDPQIKWLEEGKCSVTFYVTVTYSTGKDDTGRERYKTQLVPCRAYDATGEAIYNALKKGSPIALTGTIRVEEYEKAGEKRSVLIVDVLHWLGVPNPKEVAGPVVSINAATVTGNLARDPEIKRFDNGGCQATFTVAVNTYLGKDAERTEWVVIRANGKLAEAICNKFRKGMPITVSGLLRVDAYEKDGEKRTFSYITANTVDQWPRAQRDEIPHGERTQGVKSNQGHDFDEADPDEASFADGDEIPF